MVIATLQGGGAERVAATLASEWVAKGHGAAVVTTVAKASSAPQDYSLPPQVRRLRLDVPLTGRSRLARLVALLSLVRRLRTVLQQFRGWHIVSFGDVTNTLVLLAGTGLGLRISVCERTHPGAYPGLSPVFVLLRRWLYRSADHVVAQTKSAADWLRSECRCEAIVLPNPLRPLAEPGDPAAREHWVIAVGRLDRLKGVDTVLRAFALAHARVPGWQLAVIGRGPEAGMLTALARDLGIEARVHFVGHLLDVEPWYQRAAILAHGSRLEGFPNVLLEAMASGLAVVATDCVSGPRDLIDDGRNGYLVPVDATDEMAKRLQQLMGDALLRSRLATEGLRVRERFAASTVAARWAEALG